MLTFEDLSFYIGLSSQTIRNKFYAGEFPIPAKRIFSKILWDKKDVDKYLDKLQKIDCWQKEQETCINSLERRWYIIFLLLLQLLKERNYGNI